MTRAGVILGTAAYMAPEQARGAAVDKRADIWAFGVRALRDADRAARASRARRSPTCSPPSSSADPDWAQLPAGMPPRLRELLERCLAKDREQRLHDIGDARLELDKMLPSGQRETGPSAGDAARVPTTTRARRSWARTAVGLLVFAALAFVAGGAAVLLVLGGAGPNLDDYRLTSFATDMEPEGSPAWSPDGRSIAYLKTVGGWAQVFVRTLGVDTPTQVTRLARDASNPMWTPDGARLLFLSSASLWSISRAGGEPELVQKEVRDATLSPDGKALALWRTTTDGGKTLSTVWIASPPNAAPRQVRSRPPLR